MNEQSTVTAPAAPQQKRSLVRLYLTLMVVYGAIAGISAYGFYYNYQDGGVGVLLAVAAAVTVAATLLYVLPYKLHTIVQIVLAVLLPYVNLVLLEWFTHNPWETMSLGAFALNLPFYYFLMLFIFLLTGRLRLALVLETLFSLLVGLANYSRVLGNSETWQAFLNTIKYAIIEVPFGIVIALVLAVLLNKKIAGRSIYRTIFFLPMVCAPAAVAMVWKWLYNTQFGLINNIFHTKVAWISDPHIAWISIGVIGVWSIIGYNMVLFIGGLQEIPGDYYEAASIDGANGFRQFFSITVPLLSPTTFFIVQTRIIGALTIFDLMFMVMDKTNVALKSVQSVVYLFYQYAFTNGNKGYGATLVVLLLIFILILTFILQRLEKKIVYHN